MHLTQRSDEALIAKVRRGSGQTKSLRHGTPRHPQKVLASCVHGHGTSRHFPGPLLPAQQLTWAVAPAQQARARRIGHPQRPAS